MDGRVLGVVEAVLAATIHGSSGVVRNAEITWGTYDHIRSMRVDGSGRRVLVAMFADNEGDPAWTRDGHALAFFGSFSDSSYIYAFWPSTRKFRRLGPRSPARAYEPTWSPDAKRIAFAEDWGPNFARTTKATIKIVSLATNKRTSVTRPKRNRIDVDPAWSPDGRTIAFARQDHGPQTIYLAHPDGSATPAHNGAVAVLVARRQEPRFRARGQPLDHPPRRAGAEAHRQRTGEATRAVVARRTKAPLHLWRLHRRRRLGRKRRRHPPEARHPPSVHRGDRLATRIQVARPAVGGHLPHGGSVGTVLAVPDPQIAGHVAASDAHAQAERPPPQARLRKESEKKGADATRNPPRGWHYRPMAALWLTLLIAAPWLAAIAYARSRAPRMDGPPPSMADRARARLWL
jgi:WD40-like Beta Propeller Repeat